MADFAVAHPLAYEKRLSCDSFRRGIALKSSRFTRQSKWLLVLVLLFPIVSVHAADQAVIDKTNPAADRQTPVKAARFANRPVIDGQLTEEVWRQAGVLKDFFQLEPGDNVSLRIDRGPHCHMMKFLTQIHASDQPGQARSTVARRDDLSGNDYVGFGSIPSTIDVAPMCCSLIRWAQGDLSLH
jgi:hypothetical protein